MNYDDHKGMIGWLKEMPVVVAYVEVYGGRALPLSSSGQPLVNSKLEPTPNWIRFNLEDYDALIEAMSAIEVELAKKPESFRFRFDMRVLRKAR